MTSCVEIVLVDVTVAVLHVVLKTRCGVMKILGNDVQTSFNFTIVALEMLASSVFKTDPRNVFSCVEIVLVEVTAVVVLRGYKTRCGETKLLGNDILTVSICLEGALEIIHCSFFKRDPRLLRGVRWLIK